MAPGPHGDPAQSSSSSSQRRPLNTKSVETSRGITSRITQATARWRIFPVVYNFINSTGFFPKPRDLTSFNSSVFYFLRVDLGDKARTLHLSIGNSRPLGIINRLKLWYLESWAKEAKGVYYSTVYLLCSLKSFCVRVQKLTQSLGIVNKLSWPCQSFTHCL